MKQNLITDIIQGMLPYLNNAQCERLQEVLQYTLGCGKRKGVAIRSRYGKSI